MKTAWIVLAIISGLGLICCSGVFFTGLQVYRDIRGIQAGARGFVLANFEQDVKTWDPSGWQDKSEATKFETYKTHLGQLLNHGPWSIRGTTFSGPRDHAIATTTLTSKATFARGNGLVTYTVLCQNGAYRRGSLLIEPTKN